MAKLDVIGDIHGHLEPLQRLLRSLGYDEARGWLHPKGRRLLFVGDLVDRGPHSFEVAELVRALCLSGEHLCLLGNHELNLVQWRRDRTGPKGSNRDTIEAIESNRAGWDPILDFFETLPVAVELPDLRVTHAVWHKGCFDQLEDPLRDPPPGQNLSEFWSKAVYLHAPFESGALRPGVPTEHYGNQWEKSLEIAVKGFESAAKKPFKDNDGVLRKMVRAQWWQPEYKEVPRDKRIIYGHYWNLPPIAGHPNHFTPPYPSGHPDLRDWANTHHKLVADSGRVNVPTQAEAVCVDFNGLTKAGSRACVGAYRYPEAEVVWETAPTP